MEKELQTTYNYDFETEEEKDRKKKIDPKVKDSVDKHRLSLLEI